MEIGGWDMDGWRNGQKLTRKDSVWSQYIPVKRQPKCVECSDRPSASLSQRPHFQDAIGHAFDCCSVAVNRAAGVDLWDLFLMA